MPLKFVDGFVIMAIKRKLASCHLYMLILGWQPRCHAWSKKGSVLEMYYKTTWTRVQVK